MIFDAWRHIGDKATSAITGGAVVAIHNRERIPRLKGGGSAPLPTAKDAANQPILARKLWKIPDAVGAESSGYVEARRTLLSVQVVGIVNRRKQAVAAQPLGIDDASSAAEGKGPLERKGLAEAVQNRKRTAVVASPSAIVTVRDASEEVVRSKA